MKKNTSGKHPNHQTEDNYRLVSTAVIVTIIMVVLIRFDAHIFISEKIKVNPDQPTQPDQLNESDTTILSTPSPKSLEQIE